MFSWLNNFTIRQRITFTFATLVVLLILSGIRSIAAMQTVLDNTDLRDQISANSYQSTELQIQFMNLNAAVTEYLVSGSEQTRQSAEESYNIIVLLLDGSLAMHQERGDDTVIYETTARQLGEFWNIFQQVVALREESNQLLTNNIWQAGSILTDNIGHLHNLVSVQIVRDTLSELDEAVLLSRDYVNRYTYLRRPEAAEQVRQQTESAADLLAELESMPFLGRAEKQQIEDISMLLERFSADFETYYAKVNELKTLSDQELLVLGHTIQENLSFIRNDSLIEEGRISELIVSETEGANQLGIITQIAATILALIMSWRVSKSIIVPLKKVTGALREVEYGNFETHVPCQRRRDEIGNIARSLETFRQNGLERIRLQREYDSARNAKIRRQDEIDQLIGMFGQSTQGVFDTVSRASSHMSDTAETMRRNSRHTNDQADLVTEEAQRTLSSVEAVSAASQQLTAAIREIGVQMDRSARLSESATRQASQSSQKVALLRDAATKIGSVIDLINDIAERTSLLALNATIESARAGEAGRGFAVVANEVKNLASQTGKATEEIASQVDSIREATKQSTDAIDAIVKMIQDMYEISAAISSSVTEQQAATEEIAQRVAQVAHSSESVTGSILKVRESASQTGGNADDVHMAATSLSEEANTLSQEVRDFLDAIRALGDVNRYNKRKVKLQATAYLPEGRRVEGFVTSISPCALFFDQPVESLPGTMIKVNIDGFKESISARIASREGSGIHLQLPMNLENLNIMENQIAYLVDEKGKGLVVDSDDEYDEYDEYDLQSYLLEKNEQNEDDESSRDAA